MSLLSLLCPCCRHHVVTIDVAIVLSLPHPCCHSRHANIVVPHHCLCCVVISVPLRNCHCSHCAIAVASSLSYHHCVLVVLNVTVVTLCYSLATMTTNQNSHATLSYHGHCCSVIIVAATIALLMSLPLCHCCCTVIASLPSLSYAMGSSLLQLLCPCHHTPTAALPYLPLQEK